VTQKKIKISGRGRWQAMHFTSIFESKENHFNLCAHFFFVKIYVDIQGAFKKTILSFLEITLLERL